MRGGGEDAVFGTITDLSDVVLFCGVAFFSCLLDIPFCLQVCQMFHPCRRSGVLFLVTRALEVGSRAWRRVVLL